MAELDGDKRGVYEKYQVQRNDGKPLKGGCFVLELGDPKTWPALRVWADTVEADNPKLARDIRNVVDRAELRPWWNRKMEATDG